MNMGFNNNELETSGLIFIPDYALNGLKRCGITLETLSMYGYGTERTVGEEIVDACINKLVNGMSHKDLKDIVALDVLLQGFYFGAARYYSHTNEYNSTSRVVNNILREANYKANGWGATHDGEYAVMNIYTNINIDHNSILMSGNIKNELFTLETYNNTVYCIIHDGFINPLVRNDLEFKKQFSILLMDYMFKRLGDKVVLKSRLFRKFMRLETIEKNK